MGAESGGGGTGGRVPAVEKSAGTSPKKLVHFSNFFLDTFKQFPIFQHFQNKVAKIRGYTEFGG